MTATTKIPPPPECPSALDLLTEIALLKNSADPAEAKRAGQLFEQLLENYGTILRKLANLQKPFSGSTINLDPEDLYWRLAMKIWDRADQFDPNGGDFHAIRKQFTGWAATMLKNIVIDRIAPLKLDFTSIETLELGWDEFTETTPDPSARAKILAEILDEMDPDDAEILRWSAMFMPLDGTQMRPAREERLALCRHLNVTEAGLRKKRERALNGLRDEMKRREA